MIYLQLFISFLQIGLFSVGGGYAAMPLIQAQAVEKYGWLTIGEFTDLITIAEMTPGPIAVNSATFVGIRVAGIGGALAATLGCIMPSLIIVSILAWAYEKYRASSGVQSVLACLRPAVVALIASAALSILKVAVFNGTAFDFESLNIAGAAMFITALVLLRAAKRLSPIILIALCGAAGVALHACGLSPA